MPRVYLDHNATTPMRPEVRELVLETLERVAGNASSAHASGREARALVDDARERTAAALGVDEDEIVFTSGATESNNLALRGALAAAGPGTSLVTTQIEHPSVLEPAHALRAAGHPVTLVGVDGAARVDVDALVAASEGAALVSVAAANGEVGSLGPLDELVARGVSERALLHVDAVQALGRVPLALREQGVALASFSAHKVGGPPGAGVLVRRRGTPLVPLACGGGQEGGMRAGTENVPAIVGAALAFARAVADREEFASRARELTRLMWKELQRALPGVCALGPDVNSHARLPNTLNVSLPEGDGRVLVARLDLEGLEVSAGSACASGSLEPSPVLLAMGLDRERSRSGLRLSVGWPTTEEDVHNAVDALSKTIGRARRC